MATTADVQVGTAVIHGISGSVSITGIATFKLDDVGLDDNFQSRKYTNSAGVLTDTIVAFDRNRRLTINFLPSGATRTAAEAIVTSMLALAPLAVITLAGFTITAFNGTYNYMGGASVKATREGEVICGIQLEAQETTTAGTFGGLAVISS